MSMKVLTVRRLARHLSASQLYLCCSPSACTLMFGIGLTSK